MKITNLILELNSACNNNCVYCYIPSKLRKAHSEDGFEYLKGKILEYSKRGVKNIDFTGGEPTLCKNLLELVKYAKELGYTNRTLVTNGRRLSYQDYCKKIVLAGINRIVISFDGPDKTVAEAVTRSPGSFRQTMKAMSNVKLLKVIELGATIVINSINYKHVSCSIEKLLELDVDFINVQFLLPYVKDKNVPCALLPSSCIPSYSDSVTYLKAALDKYSDKKKIHVHFIPFCYMKGYENFVLDESIKTDRKAVNFRGFCYNIGEHLLKGSEKNEKCIDCVYNSKCVGFFPSYSKEFGITNLK